MKKKENLYTLYRLQVRDKDTAVCSFIEQTLTRTLAMFRYNGLPETIPQNELEKLLQTTGSCFVTEVDGVLYALSGAKGGAQDVYGNPTIYTVSNPALQLTKNYVIATDGVLIDNEPYGNSLLPVIGKYAVLYTDGLISLNTASILTRITMLISASDDKTKASTDEFIKKIENGDFSVIGENAFFKGVNMQTATTTNSAYINQLIELVQYYKATMYNDLGLNANYNMKRERLNLGEVSMNVDALLPYVEAMLQERQKAVKKINEKYNTNISVSLASSWKLEHENFEKLVEDTETDGDRTEPEPETKEKEETKETEEIEEKEETEETKETEEEIEEKEEEK